MKRFTSLFLAAVLSAALLGLNAGPAAAAAKKVYKWGFASQNAMTHAMGLAHQAFFDEIRKRSDGRLDITYHPMGELPINQTEFIVACGEGLIEMAAGDVSAVGGSLTSGLLPAMPFLVTGFEEAHIAINAINDSIHKDINKYGTKFLYYCIYPMQQIWGSGPVPKTAKDMAGLTIRSQGTEMSKALELLGVHPVAISAAEVTSSLSRSVIKGAVTAGITITGNSWYPYLKWGYLANLLAMPSYIVVNQKAFDALPEDLQKILQDTATEYQNTFYDKYVSSAEEREWKVLTDKYGFSLVEMTAEDRAPIVRSMKKYWFDYAKSMGPDVVKDLEKILTALKIEY
ncbi:exported hypothetical protein [uncultured delta proteobacterium]|uniref:Uncharacterized protein n=1 Tax=uncultured delta proteobacterium TaxID=34034 RepID=A0A212K356_9DELT|nr:exported hypothetical protein [uncultured delta proteobacterium]